METKTIIENGKNVKLYKRVCKKCDREDWIKYKTTAYFKDAVCKSCQLMFKGSVAMSTKQEELPQDEVKNRQMIDEWLKDNKPSIKV